MEAIILFFISFIIIFLVYLLFVLRRKKYLDKFVNGKEITYLKYRYKVRVTDKNKKKLCLSVVLTNSFIMALTFSAAITIMDDKNYLLYLLFCLVAVVGLILISYHIIGKVFQK